MELQKIFMGIAVVALGITAMLWWTNDLANTYGVADVGSSFNHTMTRVQIIQNITDIGEGVGGATQGEEGPGVEDAQEGLVRRSIRIIGLTDDLLGLVPDIMEDGATLVGIPEVYKNLAKWVFVFSFAIMIMLIIILGVQKFTS